MDQPLRNPKHEVFAQERARGATIDDAAVAAGYTPSGHAIRLSQDPSIKARITQLQRPAAEKAQMDIAALFDAFVRQGTYDPIVFAQVRTLEDLHTVPEELRRLLVKGWKWDKNGRLILDLVDKTTALDRLARHLSFYNDSLKVDVSDFDKLLARAERE